MSIAGIPVWALVLVACVVAPYAVQRWVARQGRIADARTSDLLASIDPALPSLVAARARNGRASSSDVEPSDPDERRT
jgi:hypothetical protein